MNSVRTAIYDKYTASALTYGFYYGKAPQESSFPYIVFFDVSNMNDVDFGEEREDLLVQFNIFSQNNSPTESETILTNVRSLFDDCSLTVTDWRHLYMQRGNTYSNNDYAQVPPIHGFSVEYDILIEKDKA